jgi:hypothetical protein
MYYQIGAMHILNKVSDDYGITILYFTFDDKTSVEGMKNEIRSFL